MLNRSLSMTLASYKRGENLVISERVRSFLNMNELLRIHPSTPYGMKRLEAWKAYRPGEEEQWKEEMDRQALLGRLTSEQRAELTEILQRIPDISQLPAKWKIEESTTLIDWFHIKRFLLDLRDIHHLIGVMGNHFFAHFPSDQNLVKSLLEKLNPTLPVTPSFSLHGFSPEYEKIFLEIRAEKRKLKKIRDEQNEEITEQCGLSPNSFGEWAVDRRFSFPEMIKEQMILVRQTPWESVYRRKESREEREIGHHLKRLEERLKAEEKLILHQLQGKFVGYRQEFSRWAREIGELDFLLAKWKQAATWRGVRPELAEEIEIEAGRLPKLEAYLKRNGKEFIPIDFRLKKETMVIVGPNMGGKTVVLKMIATILILSQYGLFVPARRARAPLFSWIGCLMGDEEDQEAGVSRFAGEMRLLREWLMREGKGILLLDELASGTNPSEGEALSYSVTKYLVASQKWAVHVTHFPGVLKVPGALFYQMKEFQLVSLGETRKVPCHGLEVAEQLQLPREILADARAFLQQRGEV